MNEVGAKFGNIPRPLGDVAEEAIKEARGQIIFCLHKKLWPCAIPETLKKLLASEKFAWDIWAELVSNNSNFFTSKDMPSRNPAYFKKPRPYATKLRWRKTRAMIGYPVRIPALAVKTTLGM
jgi:hypothetical protein